MKNLGLYLLLKYTINYKFNGENQNVPLNILLCYARLTQ